MNYYIEENNKIILFDFDKDKLKNTLKKYIPKYSDFEIKETKKEIVEFEGEFAFKEEVEHKLLLEKKEEKQKENIQKAKMAIENGYVSFKNAEFETNAQTVGDLLASMLLTKEANLESYPWLSKDDKIVELEAEDFGILGNLIAEFKNKIWNEIYLSYKEKIQNAKTLEGLDEIEIKYLILGN